MATSRQKDSQKAEDRAAAVLEQIKESNTASKPGKSLRSPQSSTLLRVRMPLDEPDTLTKPTKPRGGRRSRTLLGVLTKPDTESKPTKPSSSRRIRTVWVSVRGKKPSKAIRPRSKIKSAPVPRYGPAPKWQPNREAAPPLELPLPETPATKPLPLQGWVGASARGEAAKVEWVKSGELVSAKTLATAWGLTPQALGPAATRGELFSIDVQRQRYYPKEFLDLYREDIGQVNRALSALSPGEKLIFWKRPHGALGGKTVGQALSVSRDAEQLERVTRLAEAWDQ